MDDDETNAITAVDQLLARAGLIVTDDERARLRRLYPLVKSRVEQLRQLDLGQTEPAVTYRLPTRPDAGNPPD